MKIDLSNLQYKQFVSFANRAKDSDFAQMGREVKDLRPGELAHRKIVAKPSWDFKGNIWRGENSRAINDTVRDLFRATILKMCGVSSEEMLPESVRDAMKLDKFDKGKPLSARRIRAVDAALKAEVARRSSEAAPLAETLGFKGKAGGTIAGYCAPGSGLPESPDPKAELAARIKENGRIRMQNFALGLTCPVDAKDYSFHFNPDVPLDSFKVDFFRDAVVTIDGVTYSSGGVKATNQQKEEEFEKVCDAFVRLITGDKNAKFATASRAVKIQANVLMGYSTQGMDGVVMGAVGTSFDETAASSRFSITGGVREWKHEFAKDDAGNIKYNYSMKYPNGIFVHLKDEAGRHSTMNAPAGSGSYTAELTISMDKLSKFGNSDWDNIDQDHVKKLRKIEREENPGWLTELDKETPPEFKLELEDLKISYDVEVNDLNPL